MINKGLVGRNVNKLINDLRSILEPNTAMHLKVKKTNTIKDFVNVASIFHVTHLICLTKTQKNIFMRFCRVPHGPTIYFKIKDYTLGKDVRSSLRRPFMNQKLFRKSPLLVMNSFMNKDEDQPHLKLISSMFKTMFPFIDINNVKLRTVKRCVMLNYNQETGLIDLRHYAVKVKPVGLSKPVKKLVASKKIPNLSRLKSFDDIMEVEHGFTSESDGELDEVEEQRHIKVTQPMKSGGNVLFEKSAIRCIEIGPRLTLELVRITDGEFEFRKINSVDFCTIHLNKFVFLGLCKGKMMYNKSKNGEIFSDFTTDLQTKHDDNDENLELDDDDDEETYNGADDENLDLNNDDVEKEESDSDRDEDNQNNLNDNSQSDSESD